MNPPRFGKYGVLRKIASGGMAEVYLCRLAGADGFQKRVALKVIHPRYAADPQFREWFAEEARMAASFSHPNLVQVFDFGREGDDLFLAMEYVEGWNLAQAAEEARRVGLVVPPGVWRYWVEGIVSGLSALHERGIVHRDLSPSNVLLSRDGAVKITDFGIARSVGTADCDERAIAGKIGYLAPERRCGAAATVSSDLYAAGVIAVELYLGRRLFESGAVSPVEWHRWETGAGIFSFPEASEGMRGMLRKCIAAYPHQRYPTAASFLSDLARLGPPVASVPERIDFWETLFPGERDEETIPGTQEEAPRASMVREAAQRYGSRRRTLQVGVVAFAAVAIGGTFLWREMRQRSPAAVSKERFPPASPSSPPVETAGRRKTASQAPADSTGPDAPRPTPSTQSRATVVPAVSNRPEAVRIRIETNPSGAAVLLDNGGSAGTTPVTLDLSGFTGQRIFLEKEGFERQVVPREILAGGTVFRVELQTRVGTVEAIQAIPWAKVYHGDRFLGETPLTAVSLPVGEQRLRFVNEPLGVDRQERIVVLPGVNPKFILRMTGPDRR